VTSSAKPDLACLGLSSESWRANNLDCGRAWLRKAFYRPGRGKANCVFGIGIGYFLSTDTSAALIITKTRTQGARRDSRGWAALPAALVRRTDQHQAKREKSLSPIESFRRFAFRWLARLFRRTNRGAVVVHRVICSGLPPMIAAMRSLNSSTVSTRGFSSITRST